MARRAGPRTVSGDHRLSYEELRARSDALAARLAVLLPFDRSPIAVLGHKEPELLVAFLAAVKAGHPYVPLDTSLPAARITQDRRNFEGEAHAHTRPDPRAVGGIGGRASAERWSGRSLLRHLHLGQHRASRRASSSPSAA